MLLAKACQAAVGRGGRRRSRRALRLPNAANPRALDSDLRDRLRIKGESETDVATAEDMHIEVYDGPPPVHTMQIGSDTPSPDPLLEPIESVDVATRTPTRN